MRDLDGVLENTLIDKMIFGDLLDRSFKLQVMSESLERGGLQKGDSMVSDIWSSLYKVAPKIKEKVPAALTLNKALLEQLYSLPELSSLRKTCQLDELTSAIGTLRLGHNLSKLLEQNLNSQAYKEAVKKSDETSSLQELLESLQALSESVMPDSIDSPDATDSIEGNKHLQEIAQAAISQSRANKQTKQNAIEQLQQNDLEQALTYVKEQLEEKEKEAAEASAKALHDMRGKIRDAIKETAEETEDLSDALKQYRGWDGSQGTERKINPEEAFRAASALLDYRNGRKIREIAKLAGRISTVSLKTKRSKVDAPTIEQWSGVTEGKDIAKLLPQELVTLKHQVIKRDFLKRYADGKILQYEVAPYQPAGKGPIVVCIDESSSMEGEREIWAKAVALALLKIAQKERRAYTLIRFNRNAEEPIYFHPKKRVLPSKTMEAFSGFLSGGTSFEEPLKTALNVIQDHKTYKRADVIFITDGECVVSEEFKYHFTDIKSKKNISVITILIGPDADGVECFSDHIYRTEAVDAEDGRKVLSIFLSTGRE